MSTASAIAAPHQRLFARVGRLSRFGPVTTAMIIVLALIVLVAIFAPWLSPHDPLAVNLADTLAPPSARHPLGADNSGRDLASRLVWGSRTALLGPLLVVAIAGTLGTLLAIVSAWLGGAFDAVVSRILDIIFAFPGILLALVATAVLGAGLKAAVIALCIGYVPYIARIVRSAALRERDAPYVQACRVQGLTGAAICLRHLLPNVAPIVIAQMTVSFGYALVDLASISYLGLGVQAPTPDWGAMVSAGQQGLLRGDPMESVCAGLLIVITVVAFTVVGDRLADRYETGATR